MLKSSWALIKNHSFLSNPSKTIEKEVISMDRNTLKECRDILENAEELADEFFPTKNEVGKRIAALSIANILLELTKEQ
jgi:hypothetical protein